MKSVYKRAKEIYLSQHSIYECEPYFIRDRKGLIEELKKEYGMLAVKDAVKNLDLELQLNEADDINALKKILLEVLVKC